MIDDTAAKKRPRVLSGVQPSGEAHLGNYLGAFKNWVEMQEEYECFFCIVDQHMITSDGDPERLPGWIVDMAVSLISVGIDPERSTIFVQSDVPAHTELAWLFNAVTPVGDLERMTQYKDKSANLESIPVGLLNYPVLQAADILIYRADAVPVGEDQLQHLELTRDVARKWNARYGDFFPEPKSITGTGGRILGLDGKAKMSKSLGNTVGVLAEPDEIWERVRTAVTDPQRVKRDDPGRPEVCNVCSLHKLFSDEATLSDIEEQCRTAQRGCVECKNLLAESIGEAFAPFRDNAARLRENPNTIREILDAGADKARAEAAETMAVVREKMGLTWRDRIG